MTRVNVVIPTWNGRALLEAMLPTLDAQTFRDFQTSVVDNGSSDGTVAWLAREHPAVHVVALSENRGFAAAVNAGVASGTSEYVAVLNNDMELDPDWLAVLVAELDADPCAAAVGPKQRSALERTLLDGAGDVLAWTGGVTRRGIGERDAGQYDVAGPVFGASGGASLYRRATLDVVGGFEESFFAYLEDADWAMRALTLGWRSRYAPRAVVWHLGGATTRRTPGRECFLITRNHVAFVLRTFPGRWLVRWLPLLLAELVRQLATAAREGQARLVLSAWRAACRRLPATLAERRAIQAARIVAPDALELAAFGRRRGPRDAFSTRPGGQPERP